MLQRSTDDFLVVIEPQERDEYRTCVDDKRLVILPFSNLGKGSIPARNFVWQHAREQGYKRHWILDDNIREMIYYNHNKKHIISANVLFEVIETIVDRYTNVALAGPQYESLMPAKLGLRSMVRNTRIYSCILIDTALPFRWRGRYNEDTDLSLRVLKAGYCTLLFRALLQDKVATMTMNGGNTDELYRDHGRIRMALSLMRQHPDCVRMSTRWGRTQHVVDYRPFAHNRLRRRTDASQRKIQLRIDGCGQCSDAHTA